MEEKLVNEHARQRALRQAIDTEWKLREWERLGHLTPSTYGPTIDRRDLIDTEYRRSLKVYRELFRLDSLVENRRPKIK